jgi:chorismate synthase
MITGLPGPGDCALDREAINRDMARRQLGHGRGGRMKIERDSAEATGGVRHGRTLGGPVALWVANRDYANWEERMNPWPVDAAVEEVHLPRPGHADLAGRPEVRLQRRARRARARQRARDRGAGRRRRALQGVPAGARRRGRLARDAIGEVTAPARAPSRSALELRGGRRVAGALPRCGASRRWSSTSIAAQGERVARRVFEVPRFGLVPGLGSHVSWEERLDGRLAGAICSIQAIKGFELGDGFELAAPRLAGARRDLPFAVARLLPRDEPPAASRVA